MQVPADKSRVVRFGVFEVDLQEAELRKSGIRLKLQEQPFQILTMLLGRPGQTVTREELQRQLWPADTFVDFDHSLNSSIKKLREALGMILRTLASLRPCTAAATGLLPRWMALGLLPSSEVSRSHL